MKSIASDYLELAFNVYKDATAKCIADVSDIRDLETIRSRVEKEGMSFLTITLPTFAKDFERSLDQGFIDPTSFRNFRKYGLIPAFLRGITGQIFDHETGRIIDEADDSERSKDLPILVDSIRQICRMFNKIELPCSPVRTKKALTDYIAIERSFIDSSTDSVSFAEFAKVSDMLWSSCFVDFNVFNCIPKHGPGATADKISGNQKYSWRRWHKRLEPYFPLIGSAFPIGVYDYSRELKLVTLISRHNEQPVKVTPVPKTLKGPRVIAIEPVCMQFAQQAIRSYLYDKIESFWLTSGHINFRDQSINQELALTSSIDGQLATIDLSDASDRVPRDLAMVMFRSNPDLSDSIEACRSTKAVLPDGTVIGPLRKFASMGSALCFPVEAMYFYTICVMALLREQDLPVTQRNIFKVSRFVHVYGDDIIVPSTNARTVLDNLHKYNCKVNAQKTFYTGRFRESCGVDAFSGELVTPTYLRKGRPRNRRQASELISWVSTANAFYKRGYWNTSNYMFNVVERILGRLPYVRETSPGLGRVSIQGYRQIERWNPELQHFEVKVWVPVPVDRSDSIDGYAALAKSLTRLSAYPQDFFSKILGEQSTVGDANNLERSALHGAVALQRRWVPAH